MAKFEKLRINLAREELAPLADAGGASGPTRSRSEHLRQAFGSPRDFLHANRRVSHVFSFEPLPAPDGYVAGFFKRARPVELRDESLEPYDAPNYEGSLFVLSTDSDQICWLEINQRLGASKGLIESFLNYLLTNSELKDWRAHVEYFDNQDVYWTIIRERRADIARVSFEFVPPNALGGYDRVRDFLRAAQTESFPDVQKHIYRAVPGKMDLTGETLHASAEIAMKGAGDVEVRDINNRIIYSSARSRVIAEVNDEDLPTPSSPSFLNRVIAKLFG